MSFTAKDVHVVHLPGSQPADGARRTVNAAPGALQVALLFAFSIVAFWVIYGLAMHWIYGDSPNGPCRWDCIWYARIADHGYDRTASAFFPVFPALSLALAKPLRLAPELGVIITSTLCYGAAALALRSYLLKFTGPEASRIGVLLFIFSAYAVYGHAGYAEPLYFLLTVLAFWSLRERRWILAGMIGAVLSATRPTGILLVPVFLVAGLRWRMDRSRLRELIPFLIGLALIPVGLLAFAAYLQLHVGDALAFLHAQAAWARKLQNPLSMLLIGFRSFGVHPIAPFLSVAAVIGLAVAAYMIVRRFYEEGVSLLAHVLVSLSTGLISLPRHVAWQMPFVFGVTLLCVRSKIAARLAFIFSIMMFVFMAIAWASGAKFVV